MKANKNLGLGMALGIAIGSAIGVALDNIGAWIALLAFSSSCFIALLCIRNCMMLLRGFSISVRNDMDIVSLTDDHGD